MRWSARSTPLLALGFAFAAAPAGAATVSVSLGSSGSFCQNGTNDGVNESSVCSQNGSLTVDDWGASWSTAGGTSSNLVGVGSTSTAFSIDAAVAADDGGADVGQGGDRWIRAALSFVLNINVDVDDAGDTWTLNLGQSALGLFALRGDGTLTAVGNQNDGVGRVGNSGNFVVFVNGSPVGFAVAPTSFSTEASNTGSASAQFSGSRTDLGLLAGTGDASFTATISFDLQALSRDGCTGFICSSASGGEEAAVLFGLGSVIDQAVDEYSTWSRTQAPDGYNSTWTLNVTSVVPEPATLTLLGLGLAALAAARRRA
jgi:hypothetical protein